MPPDEQIEVRERPIPPLEEIERVSREFTRIFHDLRKQTFSTTSWLGVPLIKTPNDVVVFQQLIVESRPDLIVETGVYLGGSALLFATVMDALGIDGKVIAIDVDLAGVRPKVREHPRIELIEGSSVDPEVVSRVRAAAKGRRVMVDLDSDHRAHHVLEELRTYSPLVSPGCYLVVEDGFLGGRPVRPDAVPGPSEALDAWLGEEPPFVPDRWHERYLLTQNPRGYLRRVGDDAPEPRPPRPDFFITASLELSGGEDFPVSSTEDALAELEAAAADPDGEVDELRRSLNNYARKDRQLASREDLERRRHHLTVEGLLKELDIQREVLLERNRLLAREQAKLNRIHSSLPYRAYAGLRGLPLLSRFFHWRDRRRSLQARGRNKRRSMNREKQEERFMEHHRGQ